MKRCLVGVVSWCDSVRFPNRFKAFRKCVNSINKFVPKDICTIAVVDNNSSENVRKFIERSSVFDIKVLLPENIQDVGAYGVLTQIAKDQNLPFLWILENDYVLFKKGILKEAIKFLESYPQCGYLRLQKFEIDKFYKYDKAKKGRKDYDSENAVWLKNIVNNENLNWSEPINPSPNITFYINNWHFGLHGGLIHADIWNKIYPKLNRSVPYYYKLEALMRKKYHKLNLKTGILDKGAFSMEAPTVYQETLSIPLIDKLTKTFRFDKGDYGGYIKANIIRHYQKNYKNFGPVQIQLFSNSLGDAELTALKQVFSSRWLGYGDKSREFEAKFAKMIGSRYALGISSCTAGLFMSMEMLDIGRNDKVIIPSISFVGCVNAVLKAGAIPVFADVDPRTLNILPSELERLIDKNTKAVIVLHYGGIPCDIGAIKKILNKQLQKVYLIEDSANSIKSLYRKKYCGTWGDIGLFSLDVNKVITTGTGGILTTDNDQLYYKAKVMRFHGLKPALASGYDAMKARRERWWEIDLEYHGNRYITNDIMSAIALEQMKKLDRFIKKRRRIWNYYNQKLQTIKQISLPPKPPKFTKSSYYFYWIQVANEKKQLSLARYLVQNGIYTTFRYYPLHKIAYYKAKQKLENSEKIAKTTLNLPLHQNLSKKDLDRIISTVKYWSKTKYQD